MAFESHKHKALIKATVLKLPGVGMLRSLRTRGSNESRYCYSVWLRHLILLNAKEHFAPKVVAELGPGDSLGVGIAALLTGAEKLYAFDAVNTVDINKNIEILNELVELVKNKTKIPSSKEYPYLSPQLPNYDFPSHLFDSKQIEESIRRERVEEIRADLLKMAKGAINGSFINYRAPWDAKGSFQDESIDLVVSQAVMEHVLSLRDVYEALKTCLRKGGRMSHQIDFKCHGTSTKWNGHWLYGDVEWKYVNDVEGPAINRQTFKNHLDIIDQLGFEIEMTKLITRQDGIPYSEFTVKMPQTKITQEEFSTSGMFVIAKRN